MQAAIGAVTGTSLDYDGDWSALFDRDGIGEGSWNGRQLAWINAKLGSAHSSLAAARQAYATNAGFVSWDSMNTLVLGGGGSSKLLREDGSALLREDGSYILLE